ncbi:hypothetical protein [Paenibacillus periandrae]|uniref:hypothetical protein n=1 Tax=Paenibacillus periandrae TaxID=1761741 RepID=UPI001F09F1D4|nr:hypothetical protein [Paenibacillus periandrae]
MEEIILNGKSVGKYHLGWSLEELKNEFDESYNLESLDNHFTLTFKDMKFWVLRDKDMVSQIMVFGEYDGKFLDKIGIGSTISDLNKHGIKWAKEDYVYILPDYPGICFELEDIDEWDESIAPIEFISIYNS